MRSLGLFLLAAYQRLVLSLPPAGVNFRAFPHRAPLPYRGEAAFERSRLESEGERLARMVSLKETRVIAAGSELKSGISTVAAHVFDQLSTENHCLVVRPPRLPRPGALPCGPG